jgi:hypothetical protein
MPARKGPKKVNKYSLEIKRTAVRLTQVPGAKVRAERPRTRMGVTKTRW